MSSFIFILSCFLFCPFLASACLLGLSSLFCFCFGFWFVLFFFLGGRELFRFLLLLWDVISCLFVFGDGVFVFCGCCWVLSVYCLGFLFVFVCC